MRISLSSSSALFTTYIKQEEKDILISKHLCIRILIHICIYLSMYEIN